MHPSDRNCGRSQVRSDAESFFHDGFSVRLSIQLICKMREEFCVATKVRERDTNHPAEH